VKRLQAFKFELRPDVERRRLLTRFAGSCRFGFNKALAIGWLAHKLAPFNVTLEPEHMMLSESFTRPLWAQKGDTLHADFGPLGGVAVQFV
jgi:hypothetical protein